MTHFNALDAVLSARFSCRAFRPAPVPRADVERIIATAQKVPSWCNAQPWQVIVTAEAETERFRDALYAAASTTAPAPDMPWPEGYPGVYGDRRRACGFQLYDAVGIEKGDRAASAQQMMENYRLFGAPHVAIITSPKVLGPYGAMDTGGFVTAFCLAAQALEVATIPQAAIAAQAPFVRDFFDIAEDRQILCAISFGYADPDHPANTFRADRAEVADVMEWKE
ncbi:MULTISPECIES: nitroreductase family protein [Roseobacteraceae]|uniref:nitroreductase family protein n=1 Tax=Roseobacteraceae TaxID=2854170 RepID=UPI001C44B852|nr:MULTISPECIES: nitroreductase family protein [Roseobacteraceae]MBV7408995.1 nitroreductase family protein [Maritimibacter sp. DP1N21-5]MBY5934318.1 nitroreductase family protein [Tateyamaria omphalii]